MHNLGNFYCPNVMLGNIVNQFYTSWYIRMCFYDKFTYGML